MEKTKVGEKRMFQEFGKKVTRNFGRWVARRKVGCNKSLLVDCLSKTQVPAKPKGTV